MPAPLASNTMNFLGDNSIHPGRPQHTYPSADIDEDLRNGIDAGDPLTAKGRIKKRQREKDALDPDDPDRYRYKAYHIRRAFDLFGHIPTIINDGIKRNAKEAAGDFDASNMQSDRDFETFHLILNHLDGLKEDIGRLRRNPKGFRALIRKIREAADQARNNDTANLKKDIACMLTPDGTSVLSVMTKGKKASSKHDRGFDNDVMGRYLCPISLDWDNPFVRDEIREGKHAILACDWPRLLYADCDCNLDDLEAGLGRNMALVRVVKYLFTGRSAAFSETAGGKTTRSGNAALAGMKEVTPRVVAYAACMLRYAISSAETWSSMDGEFNIQEFYWHVVSIFDDSDEFGKDLLAWWNMKVFGTSLETIRNPETPSATAAISLLKRQREAKRAAKRLLGDVTNVRQQNTRRDGNAEVIDIESEDEEPFPASSFLNTRHSLPMQQEPSNYGSNSASQHFSTLSQAQQSNFQHSQTPPPSQAVTISTSESQQDSSITGTGTCMSTAKTRINAGERDRSISPSVQYAEMQVTTARARSPSTFYVRPTGTSLYSHDHNRRALPRAA